MRRTIAAYPAVHDGAHEHDPAAVHVHLVHVEPGARQQPDPGKRDSGRQPREN